MNPLKYYLSMAQFTVVLINALGLTITIIFHQLVKNADLIVTNAIHQRVVTIVLIITFCFITHLQRLHVLVTAHNIITER